MSKRKNRLILSALHAWMHENMVLLRLKGKKYPKYGFDSALCTPVEGFDALIKESEEKCDHMWKQFERLVNGEEEAPVIEYIDPNEVDF